MALLPRGFAGENQQKLELNYSSLSKMLAGKLQSFDKKSETFVFALGFTGIYLGNDMSVPVPGGKKLEHFSNRLFSVARK